MNNNDNGMHLLEKGKQSFLRMIFSRTGLILVLLIIQILFLFAIFGWFEEFLPHIYGGVIFFTLFMVLYILSSSMNNVSKITWLVVVMLMPVFGCLLFIYTQMEIGHRALKKRSQEIITEHQDLLAQDPKVLEELDQECPGAKSLAHYLSRSGAHPVSKNTSVEYYPLGEIMFEAMKVELRKAKSFIFLEYFIIDEGKMWGQILDILVAKVKEGVDVRVLYDGTNELSTLPHNYPERLKALGIKCKMFAPVTPFVSTHYNYRDHRKILVIDGHTSFNGGINIADEYINEVDHYGHWKDTGVKLVGDATRNFTMMFLEMWNLDEKEVIFKPYIDVKVDEVKNAQGYVMPYGDCPVDDDKVGEHVYIDILNRSHDYVYITSPYLIVDGEMEDALRFAAKRGIDVRIMLPGIADSGVAHGLAYSHYKTLLEAGVKIYEYTPGYTHAKMFVSDDKEAVVGTINLDYRSLYHHFECATYMYQVKCIKAIHDDFLVNQKKCHEITLANLKDIPLKRKLLGFLAKNVAPLI